MNNVNLALVLYGVFMILAGISRECYFNKKAKIIDRRGYNSSENGLNTTGRSTDILKANGYLPFNGVITGGSSVSFGEVKTERPIDKNN